MGCCTAESEKVGAEPARATDSESESLAESDWDLFEVSESYAGMNLMLV